MNKELLERLDAEIVELKFKEDDYIYVIRNNGLISDWYFTDSVEELRKFQNELLESKELAYEIIKGFDEDIEQLAKDKPFLEKMTVIDVHYELLM